VIKQAGARGGQCLWRVADRPHVGHIAFQGVMLPLLPKGGGEHHLQRQAEGQAHVPSKPHSRMFEKGKPIP
jgi:hypothetical protein